MKSNRNPNDQIGFLRVEPKAFMQQYQHNNYFNKAVRDTEVNNKKTRNVLHQSLCCGEGQKQDNIDCYNHWLMNMLSYNITMKKEIRKFEKKLKKI